MHQAWDHLGENGKLEFGPLAQVKECLDRQAPAPIPPLACRKLISYLGAHMWSKQWQGQVS